MTYSLWCGRTCDQNYDRTAPHLRLGPYRPRVVLRADLQVYFTKENLQTLPQERLDDMVTRILTPVVPGRNERRTRGSDQPQRR